MTGRDYDAARDDTDVTDEMEAELNANCVSITARGKAVAARYADRVAHEGRNKVHPIALTKPSGASAMWRATVAGLAAGLGDVAKSQTYGFYKAAGLLGLDCSVDRDFFTEGQVLRRWAAACERGERTIDTDIYEQARRGETLERGHVPNGVNCLTGGCPTCTTLNESPVEERPIIAAILAYGSDRDLYIRKSRR